MAGKKKKYTKLQKKFLEVLFDEAEGDLNKAKRLAGFSTNTKLRDVTAGLQDEIVELTKKYLAHNGPKAAYAMSNIIDKPTQLGAKDKMAAAKDILDRAGVKSSDKVEITAENPLFILPAKEKSDET